MRPRGPDPRTNLRAFAEVAPATLGGLTRGTLGAYAALLLSAAREATGTLRERLHDDVRRLRRAARTRPKLQLVDVHAHEACRASDAERARVLAGEWPPGTVDLGFPPPPHDDDRYGLLPSGAVAQMGARVLLHEGDQAARVRVQVAQHLPPDLARRLRAALVPGEAVPTLSALSEPSLRLTPLLVLPAAEARRTVVVAVDLARPRRTAALVATVDADDAPPEDARVRAGVLLEGLEAWDQLRVARARHELEQTLEGRAAVVRADLRDQLEIALAALVEPEADPWRWSREHRIGRDDLEQVFFADKVAGARAALQALVRHADPTVVLRPEHDAFELVLAPAGTWIDGMVPGGPPGWGRLEGWIPRDRPVAAARFTGPGVPPRRFDAWIWTGSRWAWLPKPWVWLPIAPERAARG